MSIGVIEGSTISDRCHHILYTRIIRGDIVAIVGRDILVSIFPGEIYDGIIDISLEGLIGMFFYFEVVLIFPEELSIVLDPCTDQGLFSSSRYHLCDLTIERP